MKPHELVEACGGRLHDNKAEAILGLHRRTPAGAFIAAVCERWPGLDAQMIQDIKRALCEEPKPVKKKEEKE